MDEPTKEELMRGNDYLQGVLHGLATGTIVAFVLAVFAAAVLS